MSNKIELGTLQMSVTVKNGELEQGSPRLAIIQDNLREVVHLIPDGSYRWTLTMDLDNAEKVINAQKP